MFFNRGNTMKKILLLSALFGGFVLNNGYCYDENHKIKEEFITSTYSESDLKSFVKDLLNSTIDGKRVVDLIYYKKLNALMLKKIWDYSTLGANVWVRDNFITFEAPITTSYRVLYDTTKITVDTNKASDNVLVETFNKKDERVWMTYITVQPSELGQVFGDMDYDPTFKTDRLQRNQLKKEIKAVKQQKQAIKPLMVEQKNVIKEIEYFFADQAKKATSPDGFRNCLKKFALWLIKVQKTLGGDFWLEGLKLVKCVQSSDIHRGFSSTRITFRCGKKLPLILIKIKREDGSFICGFDQNLKNQPDLGLVQLGNMHHAAILVKSNNFDKFLEEECGNDLSKLDPANVDTFKFKADKPEERDYADNDLLMNH